MMTDKEKLLEEIKTFCARYGLTPSGYSRKFLGYGNFVSDMERIDFSPKLSTVTKLRLQMKNHKHKGNRHEDR